MNLREMLARLRALEAERLRLFIDPDESKDEELRNWDGPQDDPEDCEA